MKHKSHLGGVLFWAIFSFFAVALPVLVSANNIICDFSDFSRGDLVVDGFELKNKTDITIDAIGAESKHSDYMFAYGWIIDADTREPVWILADEDTKRHGRNRMLREYNDDISLPAGRYEAIYFVSESVNMNGGNIIIKDFDDVGHILEAIFNDDEDEVITYSDDYNDFFDDIDELKFSLQAPSGSFVKFSPVDYVKEKAIIDFSKPEDDFIEKKGFTLKKDLTLNIHAIGEYSSGDRVFVDFGWIMNADTREKVWQMDKWNTSWAGGGRKNRYFKDEVKLPAGNYIAGFATDDSHAFGEWNTPPPYDPLHYGLTIFPADEKDRKQITDFVDEYSEPTIISITKMRNNRFEQKGFTLNKETNLHIFALGEYGYSDEFADYGWIEDISSTEIVWEMTEYNTEHAGGGKKNRKFDGVVTLPKGDYMVYYVTDDSHAYRRWNTSAPIERDMWGISIFGMGKNFDPKSVPTFDDLPESGNILVSLTGIGDDEEVRQSFELSKDQRVKIIALGEGENGRMFDYGWIEEAKSGDVIWEMTYRKTRHAGGAKKNRKASAEITLDAGKYYAYFETDGSHSFPDFNSSRPDNPQKWGIRVIKQ
ncbi:MAG: hypothetical protein DRP51_09455 [Candidatus Zixiibacteriota bacterium]|nr:MAG: hypothetical protein DRP51_09455 [candidate division Zixibacteria bacterium]